MSGFARPRFPLANATLEWDYRVEDEKAHLGQDKQVR